MSRVELEELLWEMGRAGESASGSPAESPAELPADDLLRAYREGALSPQEARRVEESLAASASARARLAELADVQPPPAPAEVRRRLLAALPAGARPRRRLALPLAAGLALAGLSLWLAVRPRPLPELRLHDAYQVTVEGLATQRSAPDSIVTLPPASSPAAGPREVLPRTRVTLRVEPRGEARSEVEMALYRRRGDRLVRLAAAPPITLVQSRGAAAFSAPAAALVGPEPGERSLYVVAGSSGGLPVQVGLAEAGEGEAERLLAAGGRRFVQVVRLRILPEPLAGGGEE